jgi:hypothetical protein
MSDTARIPDRPAAWQDISTLKLDGRQVLMSCPGGVFIAPAAKSEALSRDEQRRLIQDTGEWPDYRKWTPTHWMPLPEPARTDEVLDLKRRGFTKSQAAMMLRLPYRKVEDLWDEASATEAE